MSEFRKYRVVSKLLDCYGVAAAPQKFVTLLSEGSSSLSDPSMVPSLPAQLGSIFSLKSRTSAPPSSRHSCRSWGKRARTQSSPDVPFSDAFCRPGLDLKFAHFASAYLGGLQSALPQDPPESRLLRVSKELDGLEIDNVVPMAGSLAIEYDEPGVGMDKLAKRGNLYFPKAIPPLGMSSREDSAEHESFPIPFKIRGFTNDFEWSAGKFAQPLQELFVIEDLLDIINGVSGRFITSASPTMEASFLVDESLSPTLLASIKPTLYASHCARIIDDFVDHFDVLSSGRVLQALCGHLRTLRQETRRLTVLLEKKFGDGQLGLQQLKFHLQPYEYCLRLVATFVHECVIGGKLRGGAILLAIEGEIAKFGGDKTGRGIFESMLSEASRPFNTMVISWLLKGTIDDPYDEFFMALSAHPVARNCTSSDPSASPHAQDFAIVEKNSPMSFTPKLEKLLQIGTYHGILRAHGLDVETEMLPLIGQGSVNCFDHRRMHAMIESTFTKLNQLMLSRLNDGSQLLRSLRFCRNFYFMENSDLFSSFLDGCRLEMGKPANAMIWENVQSSWESALASTGVEGAPATLYRAESSLTEQLQRIINADNGKTRSAEAPSSLRGLDVLSMTVAFEFPYTLLFSKENLSKYELLFRFLLRLVHLSKELGSLKPVKGLPRSFWVLCRQMLHLLQNVHQYLVYEVIEARWNTFMSAIATSNGLHQITQLHADFIDTCLRQSMLTNAKLMQILNLILAQCSRLIALLATETVEEAEFNSKLSSTSGTFGKAMRTFLEALQYYSSRDYDYHLGTLFSRLDFNSFYYATSFGTASPAEQSGAATASTLRHH